MHSIRFFITCVLLFLLRATCAQVIQPAVLSAELPTQSIQVGDEIEVVFSAKVDDGWYLYAVGFDDACGPIPMSITLEPHPSFQLLGGVAAVDPKKKFDKIFECDVLIFEKQGQFKQKIKVLSTDLQLEGAYDGQACSEVEGKCVLVNGDLRFPAVKVSGGKTASPKATLPPSQPQKKDSAQISLEPVKQVEPETGIQGPIFPENLSALQPEKKSFLGFFLVSFLAGLAALLTPCVFPMIPMTVSYFTGQGQTRLKASLYGLSIVLIYTILGTVLAPLMGPETANHLSTEWLPNLLFFLIFIIFGLSFLGLFEITIPGTLITQVDRKAEKGGLGGVFFMAFTLVLISFSCTGPIVGSILVSSAGGEFVKPIIGMLGFSLAFAIPFSIFAFFPHLITSLPKSGSWLNSVKVVLGFVEIALAFKFLSIADQAFHWGILDREINIAIWIVIATLIGLYLMKAFKLPGDVSRHEEKHVSVPRLALAMIAFTFVIYLVPGMYGAPLKALAGYLPPLQTHDFNLLKAEQQKGNVCDAPKYDDFLHLPHGLTGYFDYEQALACARSQNKPLFIDFTGHGCTNCREMEAVVWSDPKVLDILQNDYVIAALYVDDKTTLPEQEWYTSAYDNKVKKTIGKQNADLQIRRLNNNAQPFYVLVGEDEQVLVEPYGYRKDPGAFADFLEEGKKQYNSRYK